MSKIHVITLAGDIASGKGVVSKILESKLKYSLYKNGEYFRQLAIEHNMNVKDFNKYVENHPEIDIQIERNATKHAKENNNLIIDARLGWYAVPDSFKVYLKVDVDVAASRLLNDTLRGEVERYSSIYEAKNGILERFKLENDRYYKLYGVKKHDLSNYDFIVDTTNLEPEEVADIIIKEYTKWLNN